jgi:hypothetical protein
MGRLIVVFLLINVALLVLAVIDCLSTDSSEVRGLPKPIWVMVILLFPTIGPGVWFVAGRPPQRLDLSPRTEPATRTEPASRPLGPDDDPVFLRKLAETSRKTEEDRLRAWEDDLHRRERELRERNQDNEPPGSTT